jgi:hypothetical protein
VPHDTGATRHDLTRRRFLERGGVAVLGGTLWATAVAAGCGRRAASSTDGPLRHLVIATEENRSFDHYYGYAPQVQASGYGPPAGSAPRRPTGSSTSRRPARPRATCGRWCRSSSRSAPDGLRFRDPAKGRDTAMSSIACHRPYRHD